MNWARVRCWLRNYHAWAWNTVEIDGKSWLKCRDCGHLEGGWAL